MQRIEEFAGRDLVWSRPRATKKEFELRSGEEVLATLRWPKAWWSTLAEAASTGGEWTFERSGFWKRKVTVRQPGSEIDLATFEPSWTGTGALTLPHGVAYRWDKEGFWRSGFVWKDAMGNPLVRFKYRMMKTEGEVEVTPSATSIPDLPLLVVFGWYLVVSSMENAAAGAAGGAAAGG